MHNLDPFLLGLRDFFDTRTLLSWALFFSLFLWLTLARFFDLEFAIILIIDDRDLDGFCVVCCESLLTFSSHALVDQVECACSAGFVVGSERGEGLQLLHLLVNRMNVRVV